MWWNSESRYLDWLPRLWEEIGEIRALGAAVEPELDALKRHARQVIHNKFPQTADLEGVRRWESLLGMTPVSPELEYRREDIVARLCTRLPINGALIQSLVENYFGLPVRLVTEGYHLTILYRGERKPLELAPLERRLRELLPANLGMTIAYDNVKWMELEDCEWGALESCTWDEVRAGVAYGEEEPWRKRQAHWE